MIIVDRFEGDIAVLETDDGMINIEKSRLSEDINESDVIVLDSEGGYIKDYNATNERRERLSALRNKLLKR
ncbi:MAG: DUF3006 domain-containing protein [Oscillospiraceae bacterium]|nr:DUF3006 domain-containing protein [Oscillospiraceae bacterium]